MQVILIRHAQADWGGSDYDRLSAQGARQAAALGQWLATRAPWRVQRLLCGPRRRHRDTAAAIHAALAQAGHAVPAVEADTDWDDSDAAALLQAFRSCFAQAPELAYVAAGATPAQGRALLRAVFAAWRSGALDAQMPETWSAFAARIARARAGVVARGGTCTLVVSSAGAIARCAQAALALHDEAMVALNVTLANAALAQFGVDANGTWQLESWNVQPLALGCAATDLSSAH